MCSRDKSETRIGFGAGMYMRDLLVEIDDSRSISHQQLAEVATVFNRYGFCLIQCSPQSNCKAQLLGFRDLFGTVAGHDRADLDGITVMTPSDKFPLYLGAGNGEHPPHTDGAYDEFPAKIMCLQCEVPARTGGLSILVSGIALYEWLADQDVELPVELSNPGVFTVKRAERCASKAIFQKDGERTQIVWRSDATARFAPGWQTTRAIALVRQFVADESHQLRFKLRPHQILVVDNTAVLHGRTAFTKGDPRKMNRINFLADGPFAKELYFGFAPARTQIPVQSVL